MKNKFLCIGLSLLLGSTLLSACHSNSVNDLNLSNNETTVNYVDVLSNQSKVPHGKYNEGVVLVKASNFTSSMLGELKYDTVNQLYKNSAWYEVKLSKGVSTEEAVNYLSELNFFEKVDFDYVMGSDGEIESIDVSSNHWSGDEKHLDNQGIKETWKYLQKEGKNPGGSSDVIVAVIDTGVDYNHIDLRNNIWTNSAEIPNNGFDDDGNGYIDDYYGWDCVGDDNDPMDDNGHGTHVAGIVAAENNSKGIVGVAFNCKVMCLKAGNSSGYFNNSDIAEAIQYAYMNGASVINMSFGGSNVSLAVEDALEDAYNQCVLVAAAGNDSFCNNGSHSPKHDVGISYPAAFPYVIGVMSSNAEGSIVSTFSNYDDTPYNNIEYEVYACGEQIPSTWPNNKIAKLSGTSMAAPVVSGIAALLRSNYQDREIYSNKYIQSQIINTVDQHPYNAIVRSIDLEHGLADAYQAFCSIPTPNVILYDSYIFDSKTIDASNDFDESVDAGEIIHVGLELHNRGGVASNVCVSIDDYRNNDPSLNDPYVDFISPQQITLGNIGTYSIRNFGKIYDDDGRVVDTQMFFEIKISNECPNDYKIKLNVHFTYNNGLDSNDNNLYSNDDAFTFTVSRGTHLPDSINEDTIFDNTHYWILNDTCTISKNATVTFTKGTYLQFFDASDGILGDWKIMPHIVNYGTIIFEGTSEENINVFSIDDDFTATIVNYGTVKAKYTNFNNFMNDIPSSVNYNAPRDFYADYCSFDNKISYGYIISSGNYYYGGSRVLHFKELTNSLVETYSHVYVDELCKSNCFVGSSYVISANFRFECDVRDCLFYTANFHKGWGGGGDPHISFAKNAYNNVFITLNNDLDSKETSFIELQSEGFDYSTNMFLGGYKNYKNDVIRNLYNSDGVCQVDFDYEANFNDMWPFVKKVEILNNKDEVINEVNNEASKIKIYFSTPVNIEQDFMVYFGSSEPFSDYAINGSFISSTVWEGTIKIKSFIEGGENRLKFGSFSSLNNPYFKSEETGNRFVFDITTNNYAQSMNMNAFASNSGIALSWVQDDYDTLMGYNIYRSNEKDGNYIKLNTSVIPTGETTFLDENAEPGKTYWYTFTVVLSDMTESAPAGKISCTATDTIAPNIYHTPVNQGYLNNNLVVSCTASDNIGIQNVTLYYRTKGSNTWKSIEMLRQNDKFSATIFGSELTLDGIEYYIVASDGYNTISKGSADNPYSIVIKDASSISRLGDVDGDGVVTTKDALMIMQAINGDLLLSDDQFIRADLNSDGLLSSVEALRILQYINGNVSSLEM